jgi:hypothetical protein
VTSSTEKTPKKGISRRTVVQGTAWAVPAVVIATAVPAYAGASQGSLTFSGLGCKLPGNATNTFKGYAFRLTASNTTSSTATVEIVSVTLNGADLGGSTVINLTGCTNLGNPFTVGPGQTLTNLALLTKLATNSQNGSLVVTFRVSTDGGITYGPTQTTNATASAPPIVGGSCPNTTFTAAEKLCISSF